jgi:hypothetical protein
MPMVVMDPFPSPAAEVPTTPEAIIGQDGRLVPQPYRCDTLTIAAGQHFEAIVEATEPGVSQASRGNVTANALPRDPVPRTSQ